MGSPKTNQLGNQVRHVLIIFSIFLFSLTIISCSSDDGSKSADNTSTTERVLDYTTAWSGLLGTTTTPRWTAAEVVAKLDRPTKIDNSTGCGNYNYMSTGTKGGGLIYPDGMERSSVSGYYSHAGRYYVYSDKYEERLGYWNDWLGLSDDIEATLDNITKTRVSLNSKIKEFQNYLELSDAELESKFAYWKNNSAKQLRETIQRSIDVWVGRRDNTKIIFAGYPLIYPDNGTKN